MDTIGSPKESKCPSIYHMVQLNTRANSVTLSPHRNRSFKFFCATVSNSTTVGILSDVLPFDHDHKYMYEGINAEKILSHFCSYVSDFYNYLQGGQSFDILKRPQNFDKLARFFFQIMLPEYLNYNIPVGFNQYLLTRPFEMTKSSQID